MPRTYVSDNPMTRFLFARLRRQLRFEGSLEEVHHGMASGFRRSQREDAWQYVPAGYRFTTFDDTAAGRPCLVFVPNENSNGGTFVPCTTEVLRESRRGGVLPFVSITKVDA